MKQRVLILGSGGFVAAHVDRALRDSDWATPVPFPGSPATLADALNGADAIFNGTVGAASSILASAHELYSALQRAGSRLRVVHFSSMTVYGSFDGEAFETTECRSDLGAYGAAQIESERLAALHPNTVILRPGCEYGAHCPQWSERIARLLLAHRLGDLGAAGDGTCNLVYIGDLVAAVMASLREPGLEGQRFNLAMRSAPTWNEYFIRFGRALGAVPISRLGRRRLKLETKLLAPPLKALELIEQRLHRPSSTPPPITPSLLNLCRQTITLNAAKAERAFDLSWMPLSEGLQRAAAAYAARS